jgi:hypothetical protein
MNTHTLSHIAALWGTHATVEAAGIALFVLLDLLGIC